MTAPVGDVAAPRGGDVSGRPVSVGDVLPVHHPDANPTGNRLRSLPCALGCTERCPGGAKAHAERLRAALLPRIRHEWWPLRRHQVAGSGTVRNTTRARRARTKPALTEPGVLPRGWFVQAAVPADRTAIPGEHLYLVCAPARPVLHPSTGQSHLVPGLWALIDQGRPHDGNEMVLSETNLWRLWLYQQEVAAARTSGPFFDPQVDVAGWLGAAIADLADPASPDEQAERTLYLLSGRWRIPPAAALR